MGISRQMVSSSCVRAFGPPCGVVEERRPAAVQASAFCCTFMRRSFSSIIGDMPQSTGSQRCTISFDAGDYEALRKLAEAQRSPLPLQYVARLAVRRFLYQPEAMLLRPARDGSR